MRSTRSGRSCERTRPTERLERRRVDSFAVICMVGCAYGRSFFGSRHKTSRTLLYNTTRSFGSCNTLSFVHYGVKIWYTNPLMRCLGTATTAATAIFSKHSRGRRFALPDAGLLVVSNVDCEPRAHEPGYAISISLLSTQKSFPSKHRCIITFLPPSPEHQL